MKPDIILILIDDMGWRDLSCCGSTFYETPNIDLIAENGVRFTDSYASCPVCSPSRASIMTGKYPARLKLTNYLGSDAHGKLTEARMINNLPLNEISVAQALKNNGYNCWHIGKWHLGDNEHSPDKFGFDVNIGGCSWGAPRHGYFSPYGHPFLKDGPEGEYLTDRLTDEAITLIETSDDTPFFMNLCHHAVHIPIEAPAHLVEKYTVKAHELKLDRIDPFVVGENFPCEHKKDLFVTRRMIQSDPAYAAMIENLDYNVGRLIESLKRKGRFDNSLIIFTSDNGGLSTAEGSPTCNLPLSEGKGWMYDGGLRVPLLAQWNGVIKKRTVCSTPTTSTDIYPTLLAAAEAEQMPEQHIDGKNILPLLKGQCINRGPLYWHYPHYGNQGGTPSCAVRDGNFKLIRFFENNEEKLFDLSADPEESHNAASEYPDKLNQLSQAMSDWLTEVNAEMPYRK